MTATITRLRSKRGNPKETQKCLAAIRAGDGRVFEQLDCESDHAFERFRLYRDMGPSRTYEAAAKALGYSAESGTPGALTKMASDYAWFERAEEFDRWIDRRKSQAFERQIDREASKWAKRQIEIRELKFSIGAKMLTLVNNRLEGMLQPAKEGGSADFLLKSLEADMPKFLRAAVAVIDSATLQSVPVDEDDLPTLPDDLTEASDETLLKYADSYADKTK